MYMSSSPAASPMNHRSAFDSHSGDATPTNVVVDEDLEGKRRRVRALFVSCFKEDLQQGKKMLMSQINNLYKMRTHGENLDYKALGYEKLRAFLCDIPGLDVQGLGNQMEAVVPPNRMDDFRSFCEFCDCNDDIDGQRFDQPLPIPESVQLKVIEVIRRSGLKEVPAKDFRDLWNATFPHEKLQIKLLGYRDIKGLLANIPAIQKVGGKYDARYVLKAGAGGAETASLGGDFGGACGDFGGACGQNQSPGPSHGQPMRLGQGHGQSPIGSYAPGHPGQQGRREAYNNYEGNSQFRQQMANDFYAARGVPQVGAMNNAVGGERAGYGASQPGPQNLPFRQHSAYAQGRDTRGHGLYDAPPHRSGLMPETRLQHHEDPGSMWSSGGLSRNAPQQFAPPQQSERNDRAPPGLRRRWPFDTWDPWGEDEEQEQPGQGQGQGGLDFLYDRPQVRHDKYPQMGMHAAPPHGQQPSQIPDGRFAIEPPRRGPGEPDHLHTGLARFGYPTPEARMPMARNGQQPMTAPEYDHRVGRQVAPNFSGDHESRGGRQAGPQHVPFPFDSQPSMILNTNMNPSRDRPPLEYGSHQYSSAPYGQESGQQSIAYIGRQPSETDETRGPAVLQRVPLDYDAHGDGMHPSMPPMARGSPTEEDEEDEEESPPAEMAAEPQKAQLSIAAQHRLERKMKKNAGKTDGGRRPAAVGCAGRGG
eukprot:TRINITY_DN11379_c0_g2_i1.p1 TRINITY_DN11379_c0_g2~~TRINITY_DN11379_c0_g2_i1.p1  ORF type:complete len:743 (+),score=108.41 TRINITY_DN11379_c0_g2_i1:126-2231(+)